MNHTENLPIAQVSGSENDLSLISILIALAKYKKILTFVPLAFALTAAGFSSVIPEIYRAETKLLPPQSAQSTTSALLSQLGGSAFAAAGVAGIKNPADLYIAMLKSRSIADKIIQRFDLKKTYETDSTEKARRVLENSTFISSGKDGVITIGFESESKTLVAPLANAYVQELSKLTMTMAVTEASQRRIFFERQLKQAKDNLANVEVEFKKRLATSGVVSVDADSRVIVETTGRIRAQISAKEIALESMSSAVTTQNPNYIRIKKDLESLQNELARLENGSKQATLPIPKKNDGLENIRILRDVKYYQMLYEMLAKQYEVARLDEAKDAPLIQVLDSAVDPERKFKPKRLLMVLVSAVFGFVIAALIAILKESKSRLLNTVEGRAQWEELRHNLRIR